MRWFCAAVCVGFLSFSTVWVEEAHADPDIVGGYDAAPGEFPYQVSLRRFGGGWCGGSLITPDWVLTAAHCVRQVPASELSVELGILYQSENGAVRDIAQIVQHPNYANGPSHTNDFALLRLAQPANGFGTVALLGQTAHGTYAAPGTMSTVSGWGALWFGGPTSDRLQGVDIPIVSEAECEAAYNTYSVDETMICAGDLSVGGIDSCQGDSGGPLVVPGPNGPVQAGVVSWGNGCAQPGIPGVYGKVAAAQAWIQATAPGASFVGTLMPAPPPDDHGDDFGTATAVSLDGAATGVLTPGDVDLFRIDFTGRRDLTVWSEGGVDLVGTLYDSAFNLLMTNNNTGGTVDFGLVADQVTGPVYLEVEGQNPSIQGAYTVVFEEAPPAPPAPPTPPAPPQSGGGGCSNNLWSLALGFPVVGLVGIRGRRD